MEIEKLKYPIGKYTFTPPDSKILNGWIETIETLPEKVKERVAPLSHAELNLSYRPEGWSIRQVVHHLADSHMNSFVRFKIVQTEDLPTIRPYQETQWAETEDVLTEPIHNSLTLLSGLHARWTTFIKSRKSEDWQRPFIHPEYPEQKTMEWMLGLYDWHCRHHLAHLEQAIKLGHQFKN